MAETLQKLIAQARVEHPCSQGHDWRFIGARPCHEEHEGCRGSRPVYECTRCPDCDYGDVLGRADCERDCRLPPRSTESSAKSNVASTRSTQK